MVYLIKKAEALGQSIDLCAIFSGIFSAGLTLVIAPRIFNPSLPVAFGASTLLGSTVAGTVAAVRRYLRYPIN